MGIFKTKNNARSTLAGALGPGTLTMTVQTGDGNNYPDITGSDFTYLFLEDSVHNLEIIKVTARALGADSMTIERAQLGTSARSWLAGDLVECRPEASQYQDGVNHVSATASAHAATAIYNTPAGNIAATTVQAAINELDTEKLGLATGGTVSGTVDFTGNVTFDGGAGTLGQVLVSQGAGATPAFGSNPAEMGTTGTGTGSLYAYNNQAGALELADLAAMSNLVDYRVANSAGTEYEIGSGSITYTNTGGVMWAEKFGAFDGRQIDGQCYGNGLRVMVGHFGKILTSSDDINWTLRDGGFGTATIYGVIYAGGQFVAFGASGKLATSPDGVTWTQRASAATAMASGNIYAAAYDTVNALYAIVGTGGYVASSPDGITWTNRKSSGDALNGIAWGLSSGGTGYFVAGGDNGAMFISTTIATWTSRTSGFGTTQILGVAYGNVSGTTPTFVAVGASGTITYSTDATFTTWAAATSSFGATNILAVAYASSKFVACGASGKISYDADGQGTWTAVTPIASGSLPSISYGNSQFIVGTDHGETQLSSSDGVTWARIGAKFDSNSIYAAAYSGGTCLIAGAAGNLCTSIDGTAWTQRTSGFSTTDILAAIYAGAKWVIAGASDTIATSPDGSAWTAYTGALGGGSAVNALTYGNSVYVAAGAGAKLFTSATALSGSWTSRTSGFTADIIYGLAYALIGATHTFVAVGAGGKIASSTDGSAAAWTLRTSPVAGDLKAVAYGAGRFVAAGVGGVFVYSSDGTTWYQADDCTAGATYTINAITYSNGLFVAVSQSSKILTSPDGLVWTLQSTTAFNYAYYAAMCDGTNFYVAGAYGSLHTSPVGVAALLLARTTQALSSNANGLVNFSAGTKNVAMTPKAVAQLSAPIADFTLSAASGVQSAFPTSGDVLTVLGQTAYEFEGQYILNTGATSHTTALAFLLARATVSSFEYVVDCITAAANTPAATQTTHVTGVASTVINAASTAVYTVIKFKGIARFTLGGTVKPQINFSADPTGTNLMKVGSFVKFTPIGSRDVAVVGSWA
jgi:hypothetical protein